MQQQVGLRAPAAARPRRGSARAARARTPDRRRRWRSASSAPASRSRGAAATAAAARVASAASRVPSRPMPVSSLTCTPRAAGVRVRRERGDLLLAPGRPRRRRARSASVSSSPLSAPMTSSGPSMPAARSAAASPAVATASQRAPPACAARAAGDRAVPVAVGLHDRAERGRRRDRASSRAVALDGPEVDPGERPHHRLLPRQGLEHVDARDDADEAAVLDDRQPVVLRARDQAAPPRGPSPRPRSSPGPRSSGRARAPRSPCAGAPRSGSSGSRNTSPPNSSK